MLRIAVSLGMALLVCGLLLGGLACNDDPPTEPHAVNLGTAEAPLLPATAALLPAHDPRILSNPQADLVKRGDTEAAEAARAETTATASVNVNLEPAASVSEALGSIGRTFVANLSASPAGTAEAPEAPTEGEAPEATGDTAPSPGGVPLADTDVAAIEQLVAAINQARAERKFAGLTEFAVAPQKAGAQAVFPLLEELAGSVNSATSAVASSQPDLQTTTEAEVAALLAPWQLAAPSGAGDDAATAEVTVGDTHATVRFVREDGQWRVAFPALPLEADVPAARDNLQAAIDRLDDLAEAAAGGSAPEGTAAQDAVTAALSLLRSYLVTG